MELISVERQEVSRGELEVSVIVAAHDVDRVIGEFDALVAGAGDLDTDEHRTQFVLNKLTYRIMRELDIRPVLTPRVHAEDPPVRGRDFAYEINFVLYPEITLSDTGPVTIVPRAIEVEKRDIESQLDFVARQFVGYAPSTPRPVAEGDVVLADVETTLNGRPVPELSGTNRLLDVRREVVPEAFVRGALGMTVGETRVIEFECQGLSHCDSRRSRGLSQDPDPAPVPENLRDGEPGQEDTKAGAAQAAGASIVDRYRVILTVREQRQEILPEIDDEWVEVHLPQFGSVGRLREHIRAELESQRDAVLAKERVFAVRSALAKRLQGTIPDALYEHSSDQMFKQFERGLLDKGMSLAEYLEAEEMTLEHFQMTIFVQACEYLRQNLALDLLFDARGMSVEEPDIEAMKLRLLPTEYLEQPDSQLEERGILFVVRQEARRQKAYEWLETNLVIHAAD